MAPSVTNSLPSPNKTNLLNEETEKTIAITTTKTPSFLGCLSEDNLQTAALPVLLL